MRDAVSLDPFLVVKYTLIHAVLLDVLVVIVVIRSVLSRAAALQNQGPRRFFDLGWIVVYAFAPTLLVPRWFGVKLPFRLFPVIAFPSSVLYGCLFSVCVPEAFRMVIVLIAAVIVLISAYVTLF